jgi:hypothetical protein
LVQTALDLFIYESFKLRGKGNVQKGLPPTEVRPDNGSSKYLSTLGTAHGAKLSPYLSL